MRVSARWLAVWRGAIAAIAAVDIVALTALTITRGASDEGWRATSALWGGLAGSPVALIALALLGLVALAVFSARRRHPLVAGALGLAALATLDQAYGMVHGTFGANFHHSGACLAGWLLGAFAARVGGLDPEADTASRTTHDRWAGTGALALFTATYLMAAYAKLAAEGLAWVTPSHLQLVVLSAVPPDAGPLAAALRDAVVGSEALATGLAAFTLAVEALAPLALCGVLPRRLAMSAVALFHLGVAATMGFIFSQAILLDLLFALPGGAADGPAEVPPPRPDRLRWLAAVALLLVAALWLLPIEPRRLPVDLLHR